MSLGAAGCGFEYEKKEHKCPHLSPDLFGHSCLKYGMILQLEENSNHPIRLQICAQDAFEYWEKEFEKHRITNKANYVS